MFGKVKTGRVVRICCIQESGAFGASFACGDWTNGTREPRGQKTVLSEAATHSGVIGQ